MRMAHVPSPRRRQSDISASLRSSPTRHYSEGSQQMGSRTAAGSKDSSPDTCEWRAKQQQGQGHGHPTESAIKAAFRQSDSYDYPCDYSEKISRGRTDSVGTTQSRSDSMLVGDEQDIPQVDKEIFREGFIYKKNSTGRTPERQKYINDELQKHFERNSCDVNYFNPFSSSSSTSTCIFRVLPQLEKSSLQDYKEIHAVRLVDCSMCYYLISIVLERSNLYCVREI